MAVKTRFPSVAQVAAELRDVKRTTEWSWLRGFDQDDIDVRLQVTDDGRWDVYHGDASYDQDHRGFWGASSLSRRSNCRELARDLLEQCKDHASQCGY